MPSRIVRERTRVEWLAWGQASVMADAVIRTLESDQLGSKPGFFTWRLCDQPTLHKSLLCALASSSWSLLQRLNEGIHVKCLELLLARSTCSVHAGDYCYY